MLLTRPPEAILHAVAAELGEPTEYASLDHLSFFESKHLELVASGWMGAGKSRVLCQKAWMVAMRYPGVTIGLFRKAQNSIAATTERTFARDVVDPTTSRQATRVGTSPSTGGASATGAVSTSWGSTRTRSRVSRPR